MNIALPFPDDPWARDVSMMLVGWLLATVLAVVLLLTVVKWAFT